MKIIFCVALTILALPVHANELQLLSLLKDKQANNQSVTEAIKAGDQRALLCKYCHGVDGNSKKSTIPNLAAQNTEYLVRQFELFANGQRKNKTMNEMARLLTTEDKVNIALFYSSQKVKPQKWYKPELKAKGKKIFSTKCFFCHGRDGYGNADFPRIASQPGEYVVHTLASYTSTLKKRAETPMSRIAIALAKDEIEALASYLTSLK